MKIVFIYKLYFLMRGFPPLKLSGTLTKIMRSDPLLMRGLTILGS